MSADHILIVIKRCALLKASRIIQCVSKAGDLNVSLGPIW